MKSRPPFRSDAGYSLVEMMIAVAMAVIVGAGIYAIFNSQRKTSSSHAARLKLQTDCNFVMDQIKQEILLAGYRSDETDDTDLTNTADKTFSAVHHKTSDPAKLFDQIDFEYFDVKAKFRDLASSDPRYDPNVAFDYGPFNEHTKIRYLLTDGVTVLPGETTPRPAGQIVRISWRWHVATRQYQQESQPQILASNIEDLKFQLFSEDNKQMLDGAFNPVTPARAKAYDQIREVRVALTCKAAKPDPLLIGSTPKITLNATVKPRNIGLEANPKDTTPPAVPRNLKAWDPGICGNLELRWDANTDSDLAGYTIFYGFAADAYAKRTRLARGPKSSGYEYFTLTGLTPTMTTDVTPSTYHIVITAYDKSGNQSTYSADIFGNPGTLADPDDDTRSEAELAVKGSDTTLNPYPPSAPIAFTATPPVGWDADPPDPTKFNKLDLSWSKSTVNGLLGYRLYRGNAAGFVPNGTTENEGNCIADESRLGPEIVSYTDAGLVGCQPYFYKLAAIHCDPTILITNINFASATATPVDRTPPSAPKLVAKPGFQRVILSLENPVTSGPGAEPDFVYTKIWYNQDTDPSPAHLPVIDNDGNVTGAAGLIPDAMPWNPATPGVFSNPGTQPAINFNHVSDGSPMNTGPNLPAQDPPVTGEFITYFFLAVSYDQCGNHSPATNSSQAQATQCGDCDPVSAPECSGAPPPPANVKAEGCDGYLTLSWDPIDSTIHSDLAGFRITRREGKTWASGIGDYEVSGTDPLWFNTIKDQTLEEKKIYSYRISSTDCYYEQSGSIFNRSDSYLEGLSIGRLQREITMPVLAGDLLQPSPTFQHNTVTFRMQNTVDGTLFLHELSARWENPLAFFQRLFVGDGNTTPVKTAFEDTANPLTNGNAGSTLTLVTTPIDALDDQIPMITTFQNQNGTVNRNTNMRQDRIDIGLLYENDSTKTASCAASTSITVPLGPVVSAVTMDKPSAGTTAWAVPGESGENKIIVTPPIIVPGQTPVTVFADVLDSTFAVGLHKVWLFYYVDTLKTYTLSPPPLTGTYDDGTGGFNYTPIALEHTVGNQWRTPVGHGIPANNNTNVWFFLLAVDNNGNFDREPEPDNGAYVYYQQLDPADCATTPNPPGLTGSSTGAQVTLTITAPSLNTDGSAYNDRKGYEVWRKVGTGLFARVATLATNAASYTYTESPPAIGTAGNDYSYYVTAVDTCTPSKVSKASSIYTECQGAALCAITLSPSDQIYAGGGFTIDLTVCSWQNGAFGETLYVQDCSTGGSDYHPIQVKEFGDTGQFRINPGNYGGVDVVKTSLIGGATDLDLKVSPNDTITVRGFATGPGAGWTSSCDTTLACSATLKVVPDPCSSPVTPGTFTLKSSDSKPCDSSSNNPTVNLTWNTPSGTVTGYEVWRCTTEGCDPLSLEGTFLKALGAGTTTYQDLPGMKLSDTGIRIRYQVRAVSCATHGLSNIYQPCP